MRKLIHPTTILPGVYGCAPGCIFPIGLVLFVHPFSTIRTTGYLHDHVLDDMLRGLGVEVEHIMAPFNPEPGAYGGAGGGGHHHHH